jgi:hypothetical protein
MVQYELEQTSGLSSKNDDGDDNGIMYKIGMLLTIPPVSQREFFCSVLFLKSVLAAV